MTLKITVRVLWGLIAVLAVTACTMLVLSMFDGIYFVKTLKENSRSAAEFGSFFGGILGTLFGATSTFLIIVTILKQHIDKEKKTTASNFFKLLDYHTENVKQLSVKHINPEKEELSSGRRSFVIFKLQINGLLKIINEINTELELSLSKEDVIDISYIIFYYGLDDQWITDTKDRISKYPRYHEIYDLLTKKIEKQSYKLGRTNQTSLSSYFRNLYHAIRLIDNDKTLNENEKKHYIKLLRAQLSNPELYVLFFNLISRFGQKWRENNYIVKYKLIKNLPRNYTKPYDPNDFFPMEYEEDELN